MFMESTTSSVGKHADIQYELSRGYIAEANTNRSTGQYDNDNNHVYGNHNKNLSLDLSGLQIILLSIIFTILQNISLSKLPGISWYIFPVVMIILSILGYYTVNHFPLSTNLCIVKTRLVINSISQLTKDMEFDLWLTVIIILLIAWVLSIWKTSISFIIWCFVIWIYNLSEYKEVRKKEDSCNWESTNGPSMRSPLDDVSSALYSSYKESSYYDKNYSASIGYINLLEKKVIQLEKRVNTLENDKLEQNIVIYTFNHNLNDKINNLEKKLQENEQLSKKDLSQIYVTLLSLKKRKRIRINILKLYIKRILLWILPTPIATVLKRVKKSIEITIRRIRGYLRSRGL